MPAYLKMFPFRPEALTYQLYPATQDFLRTLAKNQKRGCGDNNPLTTALILAVSRHVT